MTTRIQFLGSKKEAAAHHARIRKDLAESLGYDLDKLTAVQEMKLDNAVALKLVSDRLRAAQARGEDVDSKELLSVTEGLQKLLPREAAPAPAIPALYKLDPHAQLEAIVDRWIAADDQERAEQGLPPRVHDEVELQKRIEELEAENLRLRGQGGQDPKALPAQAKSERVITPSESEIIPPSEQTDSDRNLYRGPPRPPPGHDPIIHGLWRPPEPDDVSRLHTALNSDDREPWRDYVRPDGSISQHPIGGIRRDWSR